MHITDELMADALAQLQEHTGTLTQAQAALEQRVAGHERRLAALEQVVASLRARVAELESRTSWVACAEQMPPAGERVLVFDGHSVRMNWTAGGVWQAGERALVSHWMLLPGEPQGSSAPCSQALAES
jgi:hypothetical protein